MNRLATILEDFCGCTGPAFDSKTGRLTEEGSKAYQILKNIISKLDEIAEETTVNWYQTMLPWQRKELSQEELYKYAEEMREALERILDITGGVDRAINRIYCT